MPQNGATARRREHVLLRKTGISTVEALEGGSWKDMFVIFILLYSWQK